MGKTSREVKATAGKGVRWRWLTGVAGINLTCFKNFPTRRYAGISIVLVRVFIVQLFEASETLCSYSSLLPLHLLYIAVNLYL